MLWSLFFVFSELRQEVIVHFIDIGGFVELILYKYILLVRGIFRK
jgi:hypothetical protein